MGVRLIYYNKSNNGNGNGSGSGTMDHDELINRDLLNQHPIYAITGLQEVLNLLEDSIYDTNNLILEKDATTNHRIDELVLDINDINQALINIANTIIALNTVDNVIDTYTVDMDYDVSTKTIKADVKIFADDDNSNAIQVLAEGLYVPKTVTEDTDTVTWSAKSNGETLLDIFNSGLRFSHNSTSWSNLFSAAEANAWYWDTTKQSFVQPNNTSYFTGFVTNNFYDYYEHTATIKSTGADNDANGIVIGFVFDDNNNPHTLSIIAQRGNDFGSTIKFALIYDWYLPDAQIIKYLTPGNAGTGNWNSLTNGITIKVKKYKNLIDCWCSNWNSLDIVESQCLSIDLNDYAWGYLFNRKVRYGYCNISQQNSYFTNIDFHSDNSASSSKMLAYVKISQEDGNEIIVKNDGIYAPEFVIEPIADNALSRHTNGYYVESFKVSEQEDNILQKNEDGYYVRDQSNVHTVIQNDNDFSVGDFIYYSPIGKYVLAVALDDVDINIVGMVTKIIDINTFEYMWSGYFKTDIFNTDKDFIQGMPLYISDKEPGKVTQVQPDISKAVGYPVENIGIIISIERGIQYNQEASIGDFKISANDYNIRSDGFIKIIDGVDYKRTLIERLLNTLSDDFKANYIIDDIEVIRFRNSEDLYTLNSVPSGLNLFIKAF